MDTRPTHPTQDFQTLETRRKNPSKDLTKSEALNEMKQWAQDIQYQNHQKAAVELGKKPLCILVFNQQASGRDAKLLIDTLQHTLSQKWSTKPSQPNFGTNVTYKDQGYKLDFVDGNTKPDAIKGLTVQTEYADIWRRNNPAGMTTSTVVSSIEDAMLTARDLCDANAGQPAYILATGSFRLIGGLLAILEGEGITTEPSSSSA